MSSHLKRDHENKIKDLALLRASVVSEWMVLSLGIGLSSWPSNSTSSLTLCLPSIPSPFPGYGTLLLLGSCSCPMCSSGGADPILVSREREEGLANNAGTASSSHESSWAKKNRTFPGTTGKDVPSSRRYLLNWQNTSLEPWGGHLANTVEIKIKST